MTEYIPVSLSHSTMRQMFGTSTKVPKTLTKKALREAVADHPHDLDFSIESVHHGVGRRIRATAIPVGTVLEVHHDDRFVANIVNTGGIDAETGDPVLRVS